MDPFTLPDLRGKKKTMSFTIQTRDSAKAYGSGHVDVLATPALVAYMEQTALVLLDPFLPDTHTSVGSFISLNHTGAAKTNELFRCECIVTGTEGRKVTFSIRAFTPEKELGTASHTRYVVDRKKFMARVNE